jgi:asparagine synthetase B (glutamine-hydrolysing)
MIEEIPARELDAERFVDGKIREIRDAVGVGRAINALSGGVDSSAVTMLGHRALGDRLEWHGPVIAVRARGGATDDGEERVLSVDRDDHRPERIAGRRPRRARPARSPDRLQVSSDAGSSAFPLLSL